MDLKKIEIIRINIEINIKILKSFFLNKIKKKYKINTKINEKYCSDPLTLIFVRLIKYENKNK